MKYRIKKLWKITESEVKDIRLLQKRVLFWWVDIGEFDNDNLAIHSIKVPGFKKAYVKDRYEI